MVVLRGFRGLLPWNGHPHLPEKVWCGCGCVGVAGLAPGFWVLGAGALEPEAWGAPPVPLPWIAGCARWGPSALPCLAPPSIPPSALSGRRARPDTGYIGQTGVGAWCVDGAWMCVWKCVWMARRWHCASDVLPGCGLVPVVGVLMPPACPGPGVSASQLVAPARCHRLSSLP